MNGILRITSSIVLIALTVNSTILFHRLPNRFLIALAGLSNTVNKKLANIMKIFHVYATPLYRKANNPPNTPAITPTVV